MLLALGRESEARAVWRTFEPRARAIGDRATLEAAPPALRVSLPPDDTRMVSKP